MTLLEQTLEEEKATDKRLSEFAEKVGNPEAKERWFGAFRSQFRFTFLSMESDDEHTRYRLFGQRRKR